MTSEAKADDKQKMKTVAECSDKEGAVLEQKEYVEDNPHPDSEPPYSRHAKVDRDGQISSEDSHGKNFISNNISKLSKEEREELEKSISQETRRINDQIMKQQQQFQEQMRQFQENLQAQLHNSFGNNFPFGNNNPFGNQFPYNYAPPNGFPFNNNFPFNNFPFYNPYGFDSNGGAAPVPGYGSVPAPGSNSVYNSGNGFNSVAGNGFASVSGPGSQSVSVSSPGPNQGSVSVSNFGSGSNYGSSSGPGYNSVSVSSPGNNQGSVSVSNFGSGSNYGSGSATGPGGTYSSNSASVSNFGDGSGNNYGSVSASGPGYNYNQNYGPGSQQPSYAAQYQYKTEVPQTSQSRGVKTNEVNSRPTSDDESYKNYYYTAEPDTKNPRQRPHVNLALQPPYYPSEHNY